MLLIQCYKQCILNIVRRLLLKNIAFFISMLFLTGCDALFVKRVELQRPHDRFQLEAYESRKAILVSTIDRIASDNMMSCSVRPGLSRFCSQPPKTVVAFEETHGFVVCLFMLGADWEKTKFLRLAETLERELTVSLPDTTLKVSHTDELPECVIPPTQKR